MRRICIRVLVGTFAIASAASAAAARNPLRFEELAKVARIGGFDVSPDGRWIAYAVGTPVVVREPHAFRDLDRAVFRLGRAAPADRGRQARLGPGLLAGRAAGRVPVQPGRQLPDLDARPGRRRAGEGHVVPDGRQRLPVVAGRSSFLITSDVFPDCTDVACLESRVKAREKSPTKARMAERLLFRHWDSWKEGLRTHVWKVPASGGSAPSTSLRATGTCPRSPWGATSTSTCRRTGRTSSFAMNPDSVEAVSTNSDVWVVPFAGGTPRNLTAANRAFDGSPKFSPDGKWIAYRAQSRPGHEADRFRLVVLDRDVGLDPRAHRALRRLGRGLRVGSGLALDLLSNAGEGARSDHARYARGRGAGRDLARRHAREARGLP